MEFTKYEVSEYNTPRIQHCKSCSSSCEKSSDSHANKSNDKATG